MIEPKEVKLKVLEQGAVRVNSAHVYLESSDIVCIVFDMYSKYAEEPSICSGDSEPPTLLFSAGDRTMCLDESKPRDSETIVELSDYTGWNVFTCSSPTRYTLKLVLTRPQSE